MEPPQAGIDETAKRQAYKIQILIASIGFCFLLQIHLVWAQPINWDEFRFLADVHANARGELSAALLTFHVHLFKWLTGLGDEIVQIRAARLVMLVLELGTAGLIIAISRRFFSTPASLIAALAYVSFSFILQHGASFRFDPIITFLLMLSIIILVRDRLRWADAIALGGALALAVMVTVKMALALPLIVALGVWRLAISEDRRDALLKLALAAVSSAVFLGLLYQLHVSTLAGASAAASQVHLAASYDKTLSEVPLFPRYAYFRRSLLENPLHWALMAIGIATIVAAAARGRERARSLTVLAFLIPLLTILFYRNAFPYYYAFVLAPASILIAAAADRPDLRKWLWLPALVMTAAALVHHRLALSPAEENQRRTIETVHAMFTEPVPYLDRCSMIASFPQVGVFLSTLFTDSYLRERRPIMRDLLLARQPAFLIANSPLLADAVRAVPPANVSFALLPNDAAVLRENFIHHWGPIFVAGKRVLATPSGRKIELLVAGPYTIEAAAPVTIDGQRYRPGTAIQLSRGHHLVQSAMTGQLVILRWGRGLVRPNTVEPGPNDAIFGRF